MGDDNKKETQNKEKIPDLEKFSRNVPIANYDPGTPRVQATSIDNGSNGTQNNNQNNTQNNNQNSTQNNNQNDNG